MEEGISGSLASGNDWNLPPIPNLQHQAWKFVKQVPSGRVTTYGDVARALGDVAASRFVGQLMLDHGHLPGCCCHRLVRADGSLGKFVTGELGRKADLLRADGLGVESDRIELVGARWTEFRGSTPLRTLAEFQADLSEAVDTTRTFPDEPHLIGGVDVSFVPGSARAVGAFVSMDLRTPRIQYKRTLSAMIRFPYIPGYLAFRELPLLVELLRHVRSDHALPAVTLVDGSGILHPRRAGIATMLGVVSDVPTIGVTKKHLFGQVDAKELQEVGYATSNVDGETWGYAMMTEPGKPCFVSPGHQVDPMTALRIVQKCDLGRRLPEPIYWADRISRAEARASRSDT